MTQDHNRRTTLEPCFTVRSDRALVRRVIETKRRLRQQALDELAQGSFTVQDNGK